MKNTTAVDPTVSIASSNQAEMTFRQLVDSWEVPKPPTVNSIVEGEVVLAHKGGYVVSIGQKA
ncbi:MAG: hypothetical protein K8F91_21275, partial [Candidatus Obscuribacterales bacterium]|nr:hypothetical protein [Candidatus Obscuribacterales bacterium]